MKTKVTKRDRRHKRIRAKVFGTAERPRLSIFKSNRALYAQLIDDETGHTLAAATTLGGKGESGVMRAKSMGVSLAKKAAAKKVTKAVFDRGGYRYTGKVAAVADGAREEGLKF